jgi:hypothetical protein
MRMRSGFSNVGKIALLPAGPLKFQIDKSTGKGDRWSIADSTSKLLADILSRFVYLIGKNLSTRLAKSYEDLEEAYRLVYEEYRKRGYCKENLSRMHCNYFCALPDSRTLILENNGQVQGTLTLIPDSICGVPMENHFNSEIGALRSQGRRIAEVSLLALDSSLFGKKSFSLLDPKKFAYLFRLVRLVLNYSHATDITDLVISVHPKHKFLYSYIGFKEIGNVKAYRAACDNPALPMSLDLSAFFESRPRHIGAGYLVLADPPPVELYRHCYRWTKESVSELLLQKLSLWTQMPNKARDYFQEHYALKVA